MKDYQYQILEEQTESLNPESQKDDFSPSSFEELKYWIEKEDISDVEVYGLHIGSDSRKTGESGIFEENGEYVVYQNGYDGHKDILYQGPNESFAVKQFFVLYSKEKEAHEKVHKAFEEKKNKNEKIKKKKIIKGIAIGGFVFLLLLAVGFVANSTNDFPIPISSIPFAKPSEYDDYIDEQGNLYHLLKYWDNDNKKHYIWCWLEKDAEYWTVYDENLSSDKFPKGMSLNYISNPDDDDYNCSERELNFYSSKIYIDYHNHDPYENEYYLNNGELYYYLDNPLYGRYYEDLMTCQQGWYHHDKENNTWEYLGTHDELKEINEDFWYYHDYCEYYFDLYEKDFDADHQPTRFEDTDFYEDYLKDVELYNMKYN